MTEIIKTAKGWQIRRWNSWAGWESGWQVIPHVYKTRAEARTHKRLTDLIGL
jgi:hypothetical protein